MFLSILIPTYDRISQLRDCLESISYQDLTVEYEVLISENKYQNRERIANLVSEFSSLPITLYIQEDNLGMFGNWNFLLRHAEGEYLTILNDDDILLKGWSNILSKVKGNCLLGVSAAENTKELRNKYEACNISDKQFSFYDLSINDFFWGLWTNGTLGTVFHTRSLLDIELFNPDLYPISDWDLYIRYFENFGGMVCTEVLALYGREVSCTLNADTISQSMDKSYVYQKELIKVKKLRPSLKYEFISLYLYAKNFSIYQTCAQEIHSYKFPNYLLKFTIIRYVLALIPFKIMRKIF